MQARNVEKTIGGQIHRKPLVGKFTDTEWVLSCGPEIILA